MKKLLVVLGLVVLLALAGCARHGTSPGVTVEGDGCYVIDAGNGVTLTVDPTPVVAEE